jgi:hypothetical protein
MTLYVQWIQLINCIINILSNTLIKLAKGSKLRITKFELKANRNLQSSSLSSKMSLQDSIVRETLYVCNQNFDQRQFFMCVACTEELWKVWNLHQKQLSGVEDIYSEVPKFLHLHHVCLKPSCKTPFLRCDCFVYER